MDNGDIVKRFERLQSDRKTIEATWNVIERFAMPYRGQFFMDVQNENAVEWRKREVYDSTAVNALQSLAASLHGSLTTPAIKWFEFRFRKEKLNSDLMAREWLDECGKSVFDALQDSNFNLEANETYMDLCGYGTSPIIEEAKEDDDFEGLEFASVPIKECYFEADHRGQVHAFYRRLNWTASAYVSKFGKDNVPKTIQDLYDESPNDRCVVIFAIYPEPANKDADTSKKLAPERRPFQFKYILQAGAEMLGEQGGYYEMPAFLPRWRKTSESIWGNSPAMIALADILTLNETIMMRMKAIDKMIDPPQKTTERNIIGDLDLQARGLTVMRNIDNMAPLLTGSDLHAGEVEIADLRAAIRSYFHVDELELKESPAMTATEVQVRYELMQRLLGPTLGRLQADFLDPLLQRTFNILTRAGKLPDPPQSVLDENAEMDIEYMGPLSRAQKTDQVASVERWAISLANLAEVMPEIMDVPNAEEIGRGTGLMLGVPANMINDSNAVKKKQDQRQEELDRARQAELAQMEGDAQQSQNAAEQEQ